MSKLFTKEEYVKKILLSPIKCESRHSGIYTDHGVIFTGSEYYYGTDEDMSSFVTAFYEVIYKELLTQGSILDQKSGRLIDCCFAGDTINGYNTLNRCYQKLKAEKKINPEITEKLLKYKNSYHCLANFWVIPTCLGRRSPKCNRYDSVDIFLNLIDEDYNIIKSHFNYYKKLCNINSFKGAHFISHYQQLNTEQVKKLYIQNDVINLIDNAMKFINMRAEEIVADKDICDKLYTLFNSKIKLAV